MRIAILCLGSHGDVRPCVTVGCALKDQGHSVWVGTNPANEMLCVENGLPYVYVPGDLTTSFSACMGQGTAKKFELVFNLAKILRNSLEDQFEILSEKLKEVDSVIFHIGVFSVDTFSEAYQIPSLRIHFYPDVPSRYYPCSIFPPRLPFKHWTNLASHYLGPQFIWFFLRSVINKWRTRFGLKKLGFFAPISYPPIQSTPKIVAASNHLISFAPDWAKNVCVTGHFQLAKAHDFIPSQELLEFLEEGPPPVYIGFGSLTFNCNRRMTEALLSTLYKMKIRAILAGSFIHIQKDHLPEHLFFIDSVPHDWLFPKVAAVIHHGGAGTTHAGLIAGKPTLVVPFVVDQFHWGEIVYHLNCGPKPIPAKRFSQERFQEAILQLLNTESFRVESKKLSEKIEQENGIDGFINAFEEHCRNFSANR
jgi:sterol 3beta-glucosyltransferase